MDGVNRIFCWDYIEYIHEIRTYILSAYFMNVFATYIFLDQLSTVLIELLFKGENKYKAIF